MDNKQSEYIRTIEEDPSLLLVTDFYGRTIFHNAALSGRLQVMEAINSIDPHMKDRVNKSNVTPLMWASTKNQAACVKWLIDHDADVNFKTVIGYTALDYARGNQDIEDMIKKK